MGTVGARSGRIAARGLLLVALGVAAARLPLGAQELRGTVRDSTSRLFIAGAVVTTLDSLGREGRRTITDERGAFQVTAPPPETHRLRVVRLGFRPVDVDLPVARDSVTALDIVMVRIPYNLQPVRVVAGANCPRRSDRAEALALLEQARAGILTAVVSRSEKPALMKRLRIERRIDPETDRILRHHVAVDSVTGRSMSFSAARTAARFITDGFASDSGGTLTLFGPDAEVLLDDAFAGGYCFHILGRNRARPNQIGLGFQAAGRRRGRIDVDGALWIDTVARALVDIEFRYVGLDSRYDRFRPGGRVAFREMPNGSVLIDRWNLRFVGVAVDTSNDARGPTTPARRPRLTARRQPTSMILAEVGGELARATWPNGSTWTASLGTLRLHVETAQHLPSVGTTVRLDDTDYRATTDSTGTLGIHDLTPGPYAANITDDRLEPIGVELATPLTFVAVRDSTIELTLRAKTAEEYVADLCRAGKPHGAPATADMTSGDAWIVGRVVTPDGKPIADVQWSVQAVRGGHPLPTAPGGKTGTNGLFAYCQSNHLDRVVITFSKTGMESGEIARVPASALTVIDVEMTPRRSRR